MIDHGFTQCSSSSPNPNKLNGIYWSYNAIDISKSWESNTLNVKNNNLDSIETSQKALVKLESTR
jgi:hypothetical protein